MFVLQNEIFMQSDYEEFLTALSQLIEDADEKEHQGDVAKKGLDPGN